MLCPSWLLAAAVLCFHCPYVDAGRCLGLIDCMGLKTIGQKLQCIRLCRSAQDSSGHERGSSSEQQNSEEELEVESLSLGLLLSALSPDPTVLRDATGEAPHDDERRSYAMEHFRWGKPMGRKRRPVKVFTSGALEEEPEESAESVRVERRAGRHAGCSAEEQRKEHREVSHEPISAGTPHPTSAMEASRGRIRINPINPCSSSYEASLLKTHSSSEIKRVTCNLNKKHAEPKRQAMRD